MVRKEQRHPPRRNFFFFSCSCLFCLFPLTNLVCDADNFDDTIGGRSPAQEKMEPTNIDRLGREIFPYAFLLLCYAMLCCWRFSSTEFYLLGPAVTREQGQVRRPKEPRTTLNTDDSENAGEG